MGMCFLGYVEVSRKCRYYNLQVGQTQNGVYDTTCIRHTTYDVLQK